MIDSQARQLFDGLDEQLRPAISVGGVDLVPADARDLRVSVARNRERDRLSVRGNVDEHDRVSTLGFVETILHGAVGARVRASQQVGRTRRIGGA